MHETGGEKEHWRVNLYAAPRRKKISVKSDLI
jgi:hypothetical protein